MLEFLPGAAWLAIGGLIAATGPVLIHLLNRRRFNVVHWAAMDFLLQAVQRNRKILEIRDLILLALRTLCVLLIGLALAGPYFSCSSNGLSPNDPLHAIVVIDNGLSMGYETAGKTLLDDAKNRVRSLIEQLPSRSRIAIIPLCGSANDFTLEPYATKDDAKSAVDRVELVDRQGTPLSMIDLAKQAAKKSPDLPAKRVVFLSDQQANKWPKGSLAESFRDKDLPNVQLVTIGPPAGTVRENSWIEEFSVVDDFADVEIPATFLAKIRHQGPQARDNVEVTLTLTLPNGETITQNQTVDLEPNSEGKEVRFVQSIPVEPKEGRPIYIAAKVSLAEDHLHADNARYLSVPVLASVPVVFVDALGKDEDARRNRIGETHPLRQLFAPITRRNDRSPQLISVRHVTITELSEELLRDARLVVIAGVNSPEASVPLLREYMKQGGQLIIAAGGEFDPAAWNESAWVDGGGILPAPILTTVGKTAEESPKELTPFWLNTETLSQAWFRLPTASLEDQTKAYGEPIFFKAVSCDLRSESLDKTVAAEQERIADTAGREKVLHEKLDGLELKQKQNTKLTATEEEELTSVGRQLADLSAGWVTFREGVTSDVSLSVEQRAERTRPNVLATFTNEVPFLIERQIGAGRVLFFTTGLQSSWNDLKLTNAMAMFDTIVRRMLKVNVPLRTLETNERDFSLPISAADRQARFELRRPEEASPVTLDVEALGSQGYGVTVRHKTQRGFYRVSAFQPNRANSATKEDDVNKPSWEMPLAANGSAVSSELAILSSDELKERLGNAPVKVANPGEPITLEGAEIWGQHLWWLLVLAVLVLLLIEMVVLAWPSLKGGGT